MRIIYMYVYIYIYIYIYILHTQTHTHTHIHTHLTLLAHARQNLPQVPSMRGASSLKAFYTSTSRPRTQVALTQLAHAREDLPPPQACARQHSVRCKTQCAACLPALHIHKS